MKKNMASGDRVIRVIIAVMLAKLYFTKVIPGTLGITLLVVAIVFTITSFIHFCPVYRFLGIHKWEAEV